MLGSFHPAPRVCNLRCQLDLRQTIPVVKHRCISPVFRPKDSYNQIYDYFKRQRASQKHRKGSF